MNQIHTEIVSRIDVDKPKPDSPDVLAIADTIQKIRQATESERLRIYVPYDRTSPALYDLGSALIYGDKETTTASLER